MRRVKPRASQRRKAPDRILGHIKKGDGKINDGKRKTKKRKRNATRRKYPAKCTHEKKRYHNCRMSRLLLPLALPHTAAHPLLELGRILSPQPRSFYVCGTLVVRARQHGDDGQQNGLGRLNGRPALGGRLVAELVLLGRVQDGDADVTILVDCHDVPISPPSPFSGRLHSGPTYKTHIGLSPTRY